MSDRFYRDGRGDCRAEVAPSRLLLGRYLESDIQGSVAMCDDALQAIADVEAGRRRRWRLTGNAHTLSFGRRRARIRAEFGSEPDLLLPLEELRRALLAWRALLAG